MGDEGLVYFIQPFLFLNTNKFKIGMSYKNDLSRLTNGYHKGTRFISINCCMNPLFVESKIKNYLKNKYTLIAGSEYFEGNEDDILKDFLKILFENKLKNEKEIIIKEKINNNNFKLCKSCNIMKELYDSESECYECLSPCKLLNSKNYLDK